MAPPGGARSALLGVAACAVLVASASSEGCPGIYPPPAVRNLCELGWPLADAADDKVWMVAFYAPWCGHCISLQPKFIELGRRVSAEPHLAVGAVDCTVVEHQALCRKYKVTGYPTLVALAAGQATKSYDGAREVDSMERWLRKVLRDRGSQGGSANCAQGIFADGKSDRVVPLCDGHFPSRDGSKHDWLVVFYSEQAANGTDFRAAANEVAGDLGNPPRKVIRRGEQQAPRQRELLAIIGDKHRLKVTLPRAGPTARRPLAKVGAVCCDCQPPGEGGAEEFCRHQVGSPMARRLKLNEMVVVWIASGGPTRVVKQGPAPSAKGLAKAALDGLGYLGDGARRSEL